jgi:hypothetical protein
MTTLNQYFRASPDLRLDPETPPYASLSPEKKLDFLEYEVVVRDPHAPPHPATGGGDPTRELAPLVSFLSGENDGLRGVYPA